MKIKARLGRRKVLAGRGHDGELLIQLLAPAPPSQSTRPPLCLVPIVDVSGSMEGPKLAAVKWALLRLLDHLAPGDQLGFVSFDTDARIVAPLTEVTQGSRAKLRAAIRALEVGGSTNLAGGLLEGVKLVRDAAVSAELRTRLILLTDGQANVGLATGRSELVALAREHLGPVSLSAFGYGSDCEHSILADLAEEGRGSFAYIDSEDAVLTAFARELGRLVSTYAADVRLRLAPSAGAPIEVALGDLLHHGELVLSAPLALPHHAAQTGVEVAQVAVRYRDRSGKEQEESTVVRVDYVPAGSEDREDDPEVARARDERWLRDGQAAAEAQAQKGNFDAAQKTLAGLLQKLSSPDLIAFVRDHLLACYEGERSYVAQSPLRGSAALAFKKRKLLAVPQELEAAFDVAPSASEAEMERRFKAKKRGKP